MATKTKPAVVVDPTQLSDDPEILKQQIAQLQADLAAATTKKERAPRTAKTAEEKAELERKAAEKVVFTTIDYAPEGTDLRNLQNLGRNMHVYAFYKVVKYLSYNDMANLLFSLAEVVAQKTGRATADVITEITTRVPKVKGESADESEA